MGTETPKKKGKTMGRKVRGTRAEQKARKAKDKSFPGKKKVLDPDILSNMVLLEMQSLREVFDMILPDDKEKAQTIEEGLRLAMERADENEILKSTNVFCHNYCKHRLDHEDKDGLPEACESCPIASLALNPPEIELLGMAEPDENPQESDPSDPRSRMDGVENVGSKPEEKSRRINASEIEEV